MGGESQTGDFFLAVLLILAVTRIFLYAVCFNTTATDHQEPHPHPDPPPEEEGILWGFSPTWGKFLGFSHFFHGSFSNPSPFKGEVRRGMGYICRCSINVGMTFPFEGFMKQQGLLELRIFKTLAPMRWTLSVFDNVFDIHCPT